ncbi:cytochrome c biogenesis protein ResB [Tibeticola sp.]|jgi:cytochrome c biogenesis protein|uniref:cytochrome c biogenesis protein ResB n=1 Tax=Tibeticola sp. TaxID=2005368 RepID=UPI002583FE4B|nr:cytochrome c biogenesis protein ResB [Tibeticola sp.]MCI4441690.1 cytochrome c biogenesis protein ResB [Tibeticola sp.]
MTVSTQGLEVSFGSRAWRSAVELVSSMRFAISLLTVICIASVIGTVLKQHEPYPNYVNQFGPFWAEVFRSIDLYSVYSAWWFLLILAFLVLSTSLCIARNTPKILSDLRSYKEDLRETSLQAFHHRAEALLPEPPQTAAERIGRQLVQEGWRVRLQPRETAHGPGVMVAAKAGQANKLGYLAAHSAIVLICLGGLLDGDLIVRAQMLLNGKTPYNGGGLISDVPAQHRLSERNPTFRGNLFVAEGTSGDTAILSQSDGILLQELPFAVELKKFVVEYYETGMPKLFASDIVIHDKATGEKQEARVEVNHPASYKGIEIYQSSFDDGGSRVKLKAIPMRAATRPFEIEGVIGGKSQLQKGQGDDAEKLTLEYTGLRVINVENLGGREGGSDGAVDVRKVDLQSTLARHLGSGSKPSANKTLRNVGPSISYKLRDASGQAREFNNYMLPIDAGDGVPVFLLGVRETPAEPMRYLRIPADDQGSMDGFLRLRDALADPAMRAEAVRRYAARAVDPAQPQVARQLEVSAARTLALFAGADPQAGTRGAGLQAISDFLEANVPEPERERAGEVLLRILNGSLFELQALARERAGLAPLPADDALRRYMNLAVLALSDLAFYPAPMAFQLVDFQQVQASVFQVARAPGKAVVYLGCALLIIGVFAMLYVRERRLWVWLEPVAGAGEGAQSRARIAMSTHRRMLDTDRIFDDLQRKLLNRKDDQP